MGAFDVGSWNCVLKNCVILVLAGIYLRKYKHEMNAKSLKSRYCSIKDKFLNSRIVYTGARVKCLSNLHMKIKFKNTIRNKVW